MKIFKESRKYKSADTQKIKNPRQYGMYSGPTKKMPTKTSLNKNFKKRKKKIFLEGKFEQSNSQFRKEGK